MSLRRVDKVSAGEWTLADFSEGGGNRASRRSSETRSWNHVDQGHLEALALLQA